MPIHADLPQASAVEQEVIRLRRLQQDGGHEDALTGAEGLLAAWPENRDLLLIAATSLRHLRRVADAMAILQRLERLQPAFSRLHQERGLCYVQLKDAPNAIDALLLAVNINPALPASWSMLQRLYGMVGDAANVATAADHVATLKNLPSDVVAATSLFSDGELAAAEQIIRAFLLRDGDHPDAMRLLARIALAHDVLDEAEILLAAVLDLAPAYRAARYNYAETLIKRQKHAEATDQVALLLESEPSNADYLTLAATAAVGLGQHERAIAIYRDMLRDAPGSWDVPLWLGHALKTIGRLSEAIESYRAASAARPNFGDAYWSLANLKIYRFSDDEIAGMRDQEASPTTGLVDRYHLCFALGKAFEDRGETARSWEYYERGNALKRSESRYRPEVLETNTRAQIEVCTKAFFEARTGWGAPARDPIFILGLPRSGSTLLEQILASHSQVEGTQELSDIQRLVLELQGRDPDRDNPRYPAALADLSANDVAALGGRYLADTAVYRTDRPVFIDKMPNNFRHIGLIHLMLPNARIIDARREPMACCFSNLKQLFAQGQEFTYSFEDLARYYRTYLELMAHWDAALPGRVLRVHHEDVVDDLEGSVRRILDYCGLPFEQPCVEFHKTRRSVRTPSSEQVRQPIFRDGLDQWKAYEPWLGPLRDTLGEAQERYRG
ncbi:tetratricopeptide repeat-containing sulfotransferase family protein [Phenylobacterium sp.]|uniref:tetratricopeptide repeat-containing sulfotransferase family protein n=1 Tax=Phenylobacterium sp. TaxID=1871053 RepID=UPI001209D360|nr:tetratricopeptide repeat-containing sulfotransferase family protein [Phenylobacterium sp.]THD65952.1 MAG: sulfotransferase family protein [Phenylobacterium sp.]